MAAGDQAVAPGAGPSGTPAPGAAPAAPGAAPGATPAAAAPAPGATVLNVDPKVAAAAAGAVKATWPENWREEMAGGDAKELERLKRFAAPSDIYKGFREAEAKITAGPKAAPGEKATPEEVAAYRKENGIPDKPEGYKLELANGIVVGEGDKPVVNKFLGAMHAANMPPAAVNTALNTYYQLMGEKTAAEAKADGEFHDASLLELGKEFGTELPRNLNGVTALLGKHFPGDTAAQILAARDPNTGRRLGDIPGIVKGFVALMRDAMPGAMLVPAGSTNVGKGVADRIGEINKMMGDRSSAYWTDGGKIQQEYRDLIDASNKMKGQAA